MKGGAHNTKPLSDETVALRHFVDCLRDVLGFAPLYGEDPEWVPTYHALPTLYRANTKG